MDLRETDLHETSKRTTLIEKTLVVLRSPFCICLRKVKRIAFIGFLYLLLLHHFSGTSGNSKHKNILQTIAQLLQFSYFLLSKEFFEGEFPQRLLGKCSHLFICVLLNSANQQNLLGMVSTNNV